MKHIFIILFFFVHFICSINAQEVLSAGGEFYETQYGMMGWTLGEPVCKTFYSSEFYITQGFHQSSIEVKTVVQFPETNFSIKAYPNPASDYVILNVELPVMKKISYSIYSNDGRLILHSDIEESETTIPLNNFQNALYHMIVRDGVNVLKSFRILKK